MEHRYRQRKYESLAERRYRRYLWLRRKKAAQKMLAQTLMQGLKAAGAVLNAARRRRMEKVSVE